MQRVSVVGNAISGKSRLARRLAEVLGVPHVELDSIYHQSGWRPIDPDEFLARVAAITGGKGWVIDGNYRSVGRVEPSWSSWCAGRCAESCGRDVLWNRNRERLRSIVAWDPEKSIIRWAFTQHAKYRARFGSAMTSPALGHIYFVRLRSRDEVDRWLASLVPDDP